ncbi:MAG: phenylalanine--tRNA ligase subunit alpha [Bdellovibrionales bacterium GWB1_55_8]|nr:MAG: phenylalanine--tRNA ligase subunit alpha [Bdellovibrionales bacterium GWB1_55_8]
MVEKLNAIGAGALKDVSAASTLEAIEQIRISVLGKKGALSEVLKTLGSVSAQERPVIGAAANEWKRKIEAALDERKSVLEKAQLDEQLKSERIDVSLPSRLPHRGSLHPVTQTFRRINQIFSRLGFDTATGPEVETEFLNFEAANIPADHPARDMQDTFFMGPGVVLRTHTTAVQMRAMRSQKWPVRILSPGAVYRSDSDATHSPMFHQVEGLWVDRDVKMSDLKGTLLFFAREMFGPEARIRLRPSYFPFVEPGAEVDVSCFLCRAKPSDSCRVCKGTGWLEILGAGMVHPRLFETAGYGDDYRKLGLSGFAFGMGVERIAMLLHGIPDLRLMFQSDVRFLKQF